MGEGRQGERGERRIWGDGGRGRKGEVAFFFFLSPPAQKLSGGTMSMENGVCPGRH